MSAILTLCTKIYSCTLSEDLFLTMPCKIITTSFHHIFIQIKKLKKNLTREKANGAKKGLGE